jgi:hypothetical protein
MLVAFLWDVLFVCVYAWLDDWRQGGRGEQ